MDINSLAAVPHTMAATSILPEPEPNAAVLVSPTAATQDSNATAHTPWFQEKGADQRSLEEALEEVNAKLEGWSVRLQFDVDPETNKLIVSLMDAKTGETLRSKPSESELRIAKMIIEFQGHAVNTTA
jgi:flagellar protein FlaG